MSDLYDVYKEEAIRILTTVPDLLRCARAHVNGLRSPVCPAVRCTGLNENHYETPEKLVITMAGSAEVTDDAQYFGDAASRRYRIQRRWLVRKLKWYGQTLGSACTRVSSCDGTVYFSYHLIIEQASHIPA